MFSLPKISLQAKQSRMVYNIRGDREGTLILQCWGEKKNSTTVKKDVCEGKD